MFPVVLLCFFLSGFAALLYETVWTRQFAFVFGTSDLAVATVLAGYMAGLALGAAGAARLVDRVRRPVLVYGVLELGIALAALAVPFAIRATTALSVALFGHQPEPPDASYPLAGLSLASSFAILVVPTSLMGATLPLLARFAVQREEEIGPRIGLLYGTNTVGAVLGALAAGFWLLPELGMLRTVLVGVAGNAAVFAIAASLALRAPPVAPAPGPAPAAESPRPAGSRLWILPLVCASGVTSFTYEVLWTRLLGHVLGGSVYAFATMLGSFLLGIALGSAAASRLARSPGSAAVGFAAAQLGIAAAALAAFLGVDAISALARAMRVGGGSGLLPQAAIAGLALLPVSLFIGATYPFAVRTLASREEEAGSVSGRVYAWNTAGGIAGAVGAGFLLIPALGYERSLAAAAALNLALAGVAVLLLAPVRARPLAVPAVLGLATLAAVRPPLPWSLLVTSPLDWTQAQVRVDERAARAVEARILAFRPEEALYAAVGRSATVLLVPAPGGFALRTNGLPESTILRPSMPRYGTDWLSSLASLARPEGRSLLVIGFGGGALLEEVPATVAAIDVIELEPEVIAANRAVADRRGIDPLADPRLRIVLNDARGALILTDKRYDLVVSQPSHPWTAGASHLYTRDFFQLVREHLNPGGVFLQWIDFDFLDAPLLRTLVATLASAFPHVRVYHSNPLGTFFFLGSDQPFQMVDSVRRAVRAAPQDLARVGVWGPEDVEYTLALDDAGARAFAAGAPPSTDDHNLLQTRSPRVLLASLSREQVETLLRDFDPLRALDPRLDLPYLMRRLLGSDRVRALRLAESALSGRDRRLVQGLAALNDGQPRQAAAIFEALLREAPDGPAAREARVVLARLFRSQLLAGRPELLGVAAGIPEPGASVLEGWALQAREDWAGLRALEPRLAAVARQDPMYPHAIRLRVAWRRQQGGRDLLREGLVLLDSELSVLATTADLELRARVALEAGDDFSALMSLSGLQAGLEKNPDPAPLAQEALAMLQRLRVTGYDLVQREFLRERLTRLAASPRSGPG
jgi:spermidine synthase